MGQSMRRRDFIGAVVGAGVWPVAALGQEATAAVVGLLGDASLEGLRGSFAPAQRRLAEMGYIEGRNLAIEIRDGRAVPLRPDMSLAAGDKVIAIGPAECEAALHGQLIGELQSTPTG